VKPDSRKGGKNMEIIRNPSGMQKFALSAKRNGQRIGLVPTMGYFHEGHLSLMRIARKHADLVVVSNFVNPTQFAPGEDFTAYPRDFERDCRMAEGVPVDVMFTPDKNDMYPVGWRTYVEVEGWGKILCGATRPTHFRGVATIVLKLFNIVQPDVALFGWKDAQQFLLLRRMVKDLDLSIEMIGGEIIREESGLAMSSRNTYLTPEEKEEAVILSRSLSQAKRMIIEEGITDAATLKQFIRGEIKKTKHGRIDYVEIVSMESLEGMNMVKKDDTLIALAARFGKTRLIDNIRY
jgi:pantoate--beta-alanine ligase